MGYDRIAFLEVVGNEGPDAKSGKDDNGSVIRFKIILGISELTIVLANGILATFAYEPLAGITKYSD